ncbi:aminoglycoside 6'-N-acetyltransferase I [Ruminococcaceae bacterium YRB3002]|nr:aminoglycoside 6'-N-acetyltransferase I [Ruminococcaceae bacterium YRB3002]
MIRLVELSMSDLEQIKDLFRSVFMSPPWNDDWSDDVQLTHYLSELIDVSTPLVLGLYDDDRFIGVSIGRIKHWCRGTEYFIEELCISCEEQHKGYGMKFFELIEDHLRNMGIHQIFLMTDRHMPAYDFYRKLGFSEVTELVSLFKEF